MPSSYDNVNPCDFEAALAAGASTGTPREVPVPPPGSAVPYTVVPKNCEVRSLEDLLPNPVRIKQDVALHTADAFVGYVKQFATEATALFFDVDHESFTAILDYHLPENNAPSWCDHVATYHVRRSEPFKQWVATDRKQMAQLDFGRMLEERAVDIVDIEDAKILEIVSDFVAHKDATYTSAVPIQGGGQTQFVYDEVVRGAARKGDLKVPNKFVIEVPIFDGTPAARLEVRLSWRLADARVVWWYEILRLQREIEAALAALRHHVSKSLNLPVLAGVPEL